MHHLWGEQRGAVWAESSEELRFAADAVPALIAYVDTGARYVWVNETYRRWFGRAPKDIRGLHGSEVLGAAAWARLRPYVERVLAGEEVTFEDQVVYKSGPARAVRAAYIPHFDDRGRVRGFVAHVQDITELKAAEQELREADRRKDEFLAMLSHELRNPLAPIFNAVEVIQRSSPDQEELRRTSQALIAKQLGHMKRLLDDLLDVARVSHGKVQLRRQPVELSALLHEAVEVSRAAITERRQGIAIRLADEPIRLDADPTRLIQVFVNLLNNSSKYTDAGGNITLTSVADGGDAVVRVRDDGVGMSPEMLARAFELFVQDARSADRAQGGLGIGLTLVRTLVQLHGGSVQAFSEGPGHGSEFVVRLPLSPAIEMTVPRSPQSTIGTADSRPLRVLIVDDNIDAAHTLGEVLKLEGHQVSLAHDGPTALAAAKSQSPEAVLLDIGLPGMDGYAVAKRLRETGHHRTALVAITGYGRDEDFRRSRAAGFDHHLVKPVDRPALLRLIADLDHRIGENSSDRA